MIVRRIIAVTASMIALIAIALAGSLATARHDHRHGTPHAHEGSIMATPSAMSGMTGTGAVYLTITNEGETDDTLVSVSTDRADLAEVHETRDQDEIAVMMPHEGALEIPAGESVSLEPGGLHVMLIGLTDDIRLGDTFDVTLTFKEAGEVTLPVTAVFDAEEAEGGSVSVGDLIIEGAWSRPAPRIDGVGGGTPVASPAP